MTGLQQIDCFLDHDVRRVGSSATALEEAGYTGGWLAENCHDALVTSMRAIDATSTLEVGTSIAVAFSRSPMSVAYAANDLQLASGGRFILGVGTQVRAHIERRFSMPWSAPADRMLEYLTALRAIWATWNGGPKLAFNGQFYRHDLMSPVFDPGPNPHGPPPILLAGVGPKLTEVAGQAADGFIVHALSSPGYFDAVTRPALERGWEKANRSAEDFAVSWQALVVTGSTAEELHDATSAVRAQIAFYGSTPGYREVLRLHGWDERHEQLRAMAREGHWEAMTDLVDDEMLQAFSVSGAPDTISTELHRRYGTIATRVGCYTPYDISPNTLAMVGAGRSNL